MVTFIDEAKILDNHSEVNGLDGTGVSKVGKCHAEASGKPNLTNLEDIFGENVKK